METLERLWNLADTEAERTNVKPASVFEPIGLILVRPLQNMGYTSTPRNSSTFAHTGGDGVHYGLVHLEGKVSSDSPVVMTVPMNFDTENMIVGSSLHEFLCLGCEVGYFFLEQLTYEDSRSETIHLIYHPEEWFEQNYGDPELEADAQQIRCLLDLLRIEFQFKPWEQCERKLAELQRQFRSLLDIRPSD